MKPDWKDAPEWANWLAMDKNGKWTWYEHEPRKLNNNNVWWPDKGRFALAKCGMGWEESKEKRP